MSVLQQTVSLAAQLRAFSSLLSLPSQAQSVIKVFRRQGIGSADVINTARFLLSRLESLSAAPTSLSFLRFRSKSSKSSKGGQSWPLRVQRRDSVFHFVPATDSPDTRISVMASVVLSDCCTSGGKTLISRINLYPSATCRGLRPCLLWHLWPVSASALQTRKPSPNTIGPPTFARLCVTAALTAISRPKGCILIISIAKGCILRLSPPDTFIV